MPPGALNAIADLQATILVSPAEFPDSLDQPMTLIAAQRFDVSALSAGGSAGANGLGSNGYSKASSWGVHPVEDTQRMIGDTGGSLRILGGGVRLPQ